MQGQWRHYIKDSGSQAQDSPGKGDSMQAYVSVQLVLSVLQSSDASELIGFTNNTADSHPVMAEIFQGQMCFQHVQF